MSKIGVKQVTCHFLNSNYRIISECKIYWLWAPLLLWMIQSRISIWWVHHYSMSALLNPLSLHFVVLSAFDMVSNRHNKVLNCASRVFTAPQPVNQHVSGSTWRSGNLTFSSSRPMSKSGENHAHTHYNSPCVRPQLLLGTPILRICLTLDFNIPVMPGIGIGLVKAGRRRKVVSLFAQGVLQF
jgi:hypothetical protein